MTFTSADLTLVRRLTRKYALRYHMLNHWHDLISIVTADLAKRELPEDVEHHRRLICRICFTRSIDYIRNESRIPRRTIQAMKEGKELTRKQQLTVNRTVLVSFDEPENRDGWHDKSGDYMWNQTVEQEPELRVENVHRLLNGLDDRPRCLQGRQPDKRQMRMAIEMYYLCDMRMQDIGKDLGITESRVSQLIKEGLGLLRKKVELAECRVSRGDFKAAI